MLQLNLNQELVDLEWKVIKIQPQPQTATEAKLWKTEWRALLIRDIVISLLSKYSKELNDAVGGHLRLFVTAMMEKISLGDPIIPLEETERETLIKLMDAHNYDNITYRNLIKD